MTPKFRILRVGDSNWQWSLVAGNGELVAVSGEKNGFTRKADAVRAVSTIMAIVDGAEIEFVAKEVPPPLIGASGHTYAPMTPSRGITGGTSDPHPTPPGLVSELVDPAPLMETKNKAEKQG